MRCRSSAQCGTAAMLPSSYSHLFGCLDRELAALLEIGKDDVLERRIVDGPTVTEHEGSFKFDQARHLTLCAAALNDLVHTAGEHLLCGWTDNHAMGGKDGLDFAL